MVQRHTHTHSYAIIPVCTCNGWTMIHITATQIFIQRHLHVLQMPENQISRHAWIRIIFNIKQKFSTNKIKDNRQLIEETKSCFSAERGAKFETSVANSIMRKSYCRSRVFETKFFLQSIFT